MTMNNTNTKSKATERDMPYIREYRYFPGSEEIMELTYRVEDNDFQWAARLACLPNYLPANGVEDNPYSGHTYHVVYREKVSWYDRQAGTYGIAIERHFDSVPDNVVELFK